MSFQEISMNAIKFKTLIDESVAGALPELKPMLGRQVEVIALDSRSTATKEPSLSFDEFLKYRLKRPAGIEPVTLEDMEQAIAEGALALRVKTFDRRFARKDGVESIEAITS